MGKRVFCKNGQVLEMLVNVRNKYTMNVLHDISWVEYDINNRILSKYDESFNLNVDFDYDDNGNLIFHAYKNDEDGGFNYIIRKDDGNSHRYFKEYRYDENMKEIVISESFHEFNGKITNSTTKYSNGRTSSSKIRRDENGKLLNAKHVIFIKNEKITNEFFYKYNENNQCVSIKNVLNGRTSNILKYIYDSEGNRTGKEITNYSLNKNVIRDYYAFDKNHNVTYYNEIVNGNIVSEETYDFYNMSVKLTSYEYDSKDKLISKTESHINNIG